VYLVNHGVFLKVVTLHMLRWILFKEILLALP